jgi:hypothetical protein
VRRFLENERDDLTTDKAKYMLVDLVGELKKSLCRINWLGTICDNGGLSAKGPKKFQQEVMLYLPENFIVPGRYMRQRAGKFLICTY